MAYRWELLHSVPHNHKFFVDHDSQRVSACDFSGPLPHQTDDGVLWLITDKPIILRQRQNSFSTPVFSVQQGEERHIISCVREVIWLTRNYGMQIQLVDDEFDDVEKVLFVPASSLETV